MRAVAFGLAVAVTASAHAWGGSPLTFVPVAAVMGFRVALDVRHDVSPVAVNAPLISGLTFGAGLALAAHLGLGWHESIAAVTPVLVAAGAVVAVALGELWRRVSLPPLALVAVEGVVAVAGYALLRPGDLNRLQTRADDLFFREGITETVSLSSPDFAVVFGPLLQLGLGFYVGIAVLAVATWAVARRYEPGWLVVVCFAWFHTLLATIQVRFAGQSAIVIAPFAGIGLVSLLSAIDIARPVAALGRGDSADARSTDDRPRRLRTADGASAETAITSLALSDSTRVRGYLVATVAVVLLFNFLLVPPLVGQTTHDRAQFDAALTVDAHADQADREYPANFVLSRWGDNRTDNYVVSGESQSYGYARSTHGRFLASPSPNTQYGDLRNRAGYVVITDRGVASVTNSPYAASCERLGVGANDTASVGHYRLLATDDGVRTFAPVSGATIRVTDPSGGAVTATTTVKIGGTDYEYARTTPVANGTATLRVAHPGAYRIGNRTVTVSNDDVFTGNQTVVSVS